MISTTACEWWCWKSLMVLLSFQLSFVVDGGIWICSLKYSVFGKVKLYLLKDLSVFWQILITMVMMMKKKSVICGADEFLLVWATGEANYAPVRHLTRSHPRLLCTKILVSAISGVVMIMVTMVAHHCRQKMMNIARPSKEILVQFT